MILYAIQTKNLDQAEAFIATEPFADTDSVYTVVRDRNDARETINDFLELFPQCRGRTVYVVFGKQPKRGRVKT